MIISKEEEIRLLKNRREKECFSVINRGKLWYDTLSYEEIAELKDWYYKWLDVTVTRKVPKKPKWLKNKTNTEEIIY